LGQPSAEAADGALGAKADTFGDDSRRNGLYAVEVRKRYAEVDPAAKAAKLAALTASVERLKTRVGVSAAKGSWPGVVDACNAELFTFKATLGELTKLMSGGKVCLAGQNPNDCPLQLKQGVVLKRVNEVFLLASNKKLDAALEAFAEFLASFEDYVENL